MAKKRRNVVGSVYKPKEVGQVPYIKMRDSGKIYRCESAKFQLESLENAVKSGKLSPDIGDKVRERLEKIPAFVLFELVELVDAE